MCCRYIDFVCSKTFVDCLYLVRSLLVFATHSLSRFLRKSLDSCCPKFHRVPYQFDQLFRPYLRRIPTGTSRFLGTSAAPSSTAVRCASHELFPAYLPLGLDYLVYLLCVNVCVPCAPCPFAVFLPACYYFMYCP